MEFSEYEKLSEPSTKTVTGVASQMYDCSRLFCLTISRSLAYTNPGATQRYDIYYAPGLVFWIICLGLCEWLYLQIMRIPSRIATEVVGRNKDAFKALMMEGTLYIVLVSLLKGLCEYLSHSFYWRTRDILFGLFLERRRLKLLDKIDENFDNIDQRIGVDLDRYSELLSRLLPTLVTSIPMIIIYTLLCVKNIAWYVPCLNFGQFILFFLISHIYLTHEYSKSVTEKERHEGNFRHSLSMVRSCDAEIHMTQRGMIFFNTELGLLISRVLTSIRSICTWRGLLETCRSLQAYSGSILAYLVVGLILLSSTQYKDSKKEVLAGILSLYTSMSMSLMDKMGTLFTMLPLLGEYLGHAFRIYPLFYFEAERIEPELVEQTCSAKSENVVAEFHNVDIRTPDMRLLARSLCFDLKLKENLSIIGPSGSGKTSIIRVLLDAFKGMKVSGYAYFKYKTGDLSSHDDHKISIDYLVITSEPVLISGSVFDQLCYPLPSSLCKIGEKMRPGAYDETISHALAAVGLERLSSNGELHKTFEASEWVEMLSPGERQRMGLARIFFHKPALAILDEATCVLDEPREWSIYSKLAELSMTQFIIISHRPIRDIKIHKIIKLHDEGGYEFTEMH